MSVTIGGLGLSLISHIGLPGKRLIMQARSRNAAMR